MYRYVQRSGHHAASISRKIQWVKTFSPQTSIRHALKTIAYLGDMTFCCIAAIAEANEGSEMAVQCIDNNRHLAELIEKTGTTVVFLYFFAQWCGPCRLLGPIFEQLSERHPRCLFVKVRIVIYCGLHARKSGILRVQYAS